MNNKKEFMVLIFILALSAVLRFNNLMHDSPFFFNPDERNMAIAVTRFILPAKLSQIPFCLISEFSFTRRSAGEGGLQSENCSLNPHFFAYGQFPLYLAYVSDQITRPVVNLISKQPLTTTNQGLTTDFATAVFWLRFYSVLSSVLTVLMVYLISNLILSSYFSLLASIIAAFSPGLIQSAHFGTTESLLTFFFLSVIFFSLKLSKTISEKNPRKFAILNSKFLILISLSIGLSLGSKLTGLFFFFPPILVLLSELLKSSTEKNKKFPIFILGMTFPGRKLLQLSFLGFVIIFLTLIIYIISSPYNLVEPNDFRSAVFGYESDVATGRYEAFYTRQFVNSLPLLYQTEKIFPYALGWPVLLLGFAGFIFLLSKIKDLKIFILVSSFLLYLIPNAFLFAKWTRFMTPVFPFFAIYAGYLIYISQKLIPKKPFHILSFILLIIALSPGLAFMAVYTNADSRVTASRWIYENLPPDSYVLSETANVVDIPLGLPSSDLKPRPYNLTVVSFDFYHLDENPALFSQLTDHLEKANFIFIPSRRIFKNYPLQPEKYKLVTRYYQLLFSGMLGFEKQMEFSSFPQLNLGPLNLQFPDEDAEETFTVFDHPVIRIYKKIKPLTKNDYYQLFQN